MKLRIKYYPISHGHIVAAWHLIYLSNNYKGINVKDAINIVFRSGKLGGTVPAKKGLKLCIDYGFLRIHGKELHVTEKVESSILPSCKTEELNLPVLRAILLHILSFHNFEWLIFYNADAEIFRASLLENDRYWENLLTNAKLFDFDDKDVNKWWDVVLSKYEEYKDGVKKAIGDVGERLTYRSELQRIARDGYDHPRTYVKWASRISDRFGFDILSIRGNYFYESFQKLDSIQIEVKSSDSNNLESFRFFISKPEWNKAEENIDSYYFFCWTGVNTDNETAENGPIVIPAKDLRPQVPSDNSDYCQWSECRCVLNLKHYEVIL